jgi:soluble lytic murein transglycosylase-like protein
LVWLAGLGLVLGSIFFFWLTVSRLQAESQAIPSADVETLQQLPSQPPVAAPDFGEDRVPAHRPEDSGARIELSYEEMFQEVALMYGLDWHLLAELAYQESRMNALALGKDNDMGLMQIIPSTWEEWAPQVGVSDPFDPYSNVLVGAAYLAYVRDYCQAKGRPEIYWMVVGYNWGPDNLRQLFEQNGDWAQVPPRQRRYALEILQAVSDNSARWKE